jgi:hypothetical protein
VGWRAITVLSEQPSDHRGSEDRPPKRVDGLQVRIEWLPVRRFNSLVDTPTDWNRVMDYLGLSADHVTIDRAWLMGAPAVRVSGPTPQGWGAAVIGNCRGYIQVVHLLAPTERDFLRFERTWRRIAAGITPLPCVVVSPESARAVLDEEI